MKNLEDVILEDVIKDVYDVVKFSKPAELAFEEYYRNPNDKNMLGILSTVTETDFFKLSENEQKYAAFSIGLFVKNLDNNVESESRKKSTITPAVSLMDVLTKQYLDGKKQDDNLRKRIVNLLECNSVDEIIQYIRTYLVYYIKEPFNVVWLVKNLIEAEKEPVQVLKKWFVLDFIRKVSGKKEVKEEEK